jgi:hypothetical protein
MDNYTIQTIQPPSTLVFVGMMLFQAAVLVLLAAIGAWLAIRFEKWREARK